MAEKKAEKQVTSNRFGHPGIIGRSFNKILSLIVLNVQRYDPETEKGYQRDLIETWIDILAKEWCDALCGVISVVIRPDGTYWVVDGQQRVAAMLIRGIKKVACRVTPVDGELSTESWMFIGFNKNRKSVSPLGTYHAALGHELPEALVVQRTAKDIGYEVVGKGKNKGHHIVACPSKMLFLARRNPVVFRRAMEASATIHDGSCIDNRILNGLFNLELYFMRYEWPEKTRQESVTDPKNTAIWKAAGVDVILAAMKGKKTKRDSNNTIRPQVNGLIEILNEDLKGRGPSKARPVLTPLIPQHRQKS